jgi:hypothetical protein
LCDQRHETPVVALEGDQRARIQGQSRHRLLSTRRRRRHTERAVGRTTF